MSELRQMHVLTHRAIETINEIVETLSFDDAHVAIGIVRKHLESRAEQTAPDKDLSDLLGV